MTPFSKTDYIYLAAVGNEYFNNMTKNKLINTGGYAIVDICNDGAGNRCGEKDFPKDLRRKSEDAMTGLPRFFRLITAVFLFMAGTLVQLYGQTVLINPTGAGGFELGNTFPSNGWTVVNGSYQNYWVIGTATKYAGTNSAFISNNGTRNEYSLNRTSTVHFYRDITVPAGEEEIVLSFYLNGTVENFMGTIYDRLLVYIAPTSVTPVAGAPVSDGTDITGATLVYSQPATVTPYALQEIVLPTTLAGTTFRLIFTWQNDGSQGTYPPASVDNISLISNVDYPNRYAVADGNWSSTSTWSYTSGGPAGARIPGPDDNVYIEGNHTVTLDRNTPALTLLNIASGSTLKTTGTYNTTAVTLTVNGTYLNESTGSITTTTMSVNNGGVYQHNQDGGDIPTATWAPASTCLITGVTGNLPTNTTFGQTFGNLSWNCTGQNADLSFAANLTTLLGNLNIMSTGSGSLRLMNGGGSTSYTTNVAGNFTQSGGKFYVIGDYTSSGDMTLAVLGSLTVSAGTFYMSGSTHTGSAATLYVGGDFAVSSGATFTETGSGGCDVYFNGTTSQLFTLGGTMSGTMNFTVNSGATLQMGTGASPSVLSGGTNCAFTVASGGTLGVTSPAGITVAGTAAGNIQVTTRTYSAGASYIYNGTSAQVTGSGLTANTPAKLTINNSAGVTLSAATTISGLLTMTAGTLNMAAYNFTAGSLTGSSDIQGTSGNLTLTVGSDNTSPAAYSGQIRNGTATTVALTKTGTGQLTLANASHTYTGLTTINGGEVRLNPVSTTATFASQVYLNGGTLSTSGITAGTTITFAKALNLNANSTISLSSNSHSLKFLDSSGTTWNGASLVISNWGKSGGKVFFGTTAGGLIAGQLSKITFAGYTGTASILGTGEVVPQMSSITIGSDSPAYAAADVNQGSVDNPVYRFSLTTTTSQAVLSGLQIPVAGTFVAGDLVVLKAWYSGLSTFSTSSSTLLSATMAPTGAGTFVFTNWTNQVIPSGTTGYVFITADIACSATAANYFSVGAVSAGDVSVYGDVLGSTSNGGTQTITAVTMTPVTVFNATGGDASSVLTWNDPTSCYDEVMVVVRESYDVTGIPTYGATYNASLVYGSGTSFGGGYVVYRGTTSPQTVTSLINGLTYHFTLYTRKGTVWSSGVTAVATMVTPQVGDYRSAVTSGTWNSLSTWQYYNGSSWVTPTGGFGKPGVPNNNSGRIEILYGHNIIVAAPVTVDQVTVDAGAKVSVSSTTLTIDDGDDAVDFIVNGTLYVTGSGGGGGTITTWGTLAFNSGAVYQHDRTAGAIPNATWDPQSTCLITGITTNVCSGWGQTFGNVTWNCASQSRSNINLAGNPQTIQGDLTIISTGSGRLSLGTNQTTGPAIAGDFSQVGGYFYVTGNSSNAGASKTMSVAGNFTLTGGTFDLSSASTGTGTDVAVNVAGNFTVTAGKITQSGTSTTCGIVFNGNGTEQRYTSGCTIDRAVNFTIKSPAYVQMGTGAANAVIPSTATGKFTIESGATLGVTSQQGITISGANGNIQNAGTRTYSAGASYIYNGTLAQSTGDGLTLSNPLNLTINNTGDTGFNIVSLTSSPTLTGNLTVTKGVFDLKTFTCDRNVSGGTVSLAAGTTLRIGGTNTFPANYGTKTLAATSTTEYYGTTQSVGAVGSPGYGNLTITNTGVATAAGLTYVQGNFTINSGASYAASSYIHYLSGNWVNNGTFTAGTSIALFQGTTQTIGGTASTTFSSLTANSSVSLTLGINTSIAGNLRVARGTMDLGTYTCNRTASGGILTLVDGSTLKIGGTNTMPANFATHTIGTASTVWYSGAAQTIYPEVPVAGTGGYGNLTLSGTGAKTIAAGTAVTVNTALTTGDLLVIESSGLSSSGSLIVKGSSTGTLTYNRQLRTEAGYGDYQYISSPVASNTATNATKITTVYGWNEVGGTWPTTTMTALETGRGYNIDQTTVSDGKIAFTGTVATAATIPATSPYADFIDKNLANYSSRTYVGAGAHSGVARSLTNYGGGGWNLLGNPFTSAMLVSSFINANKFEFDPNYVAVYLYDPSIGTKGAYYYIGNSTGWGTGTSQTHVQAGQGFYVMAMNDSSTFNFTTTMQEHAATDAVFKSTKSEERWSGLRIKVKQADVESYTTIVFSSDMTKGVDPGYDIGELSSYPDVDIYSILQLENGVNYAQQALPSEGIDSLIIPLGIDCAAGGEITFSAETEPLDGYNYLLEDRTTSTLTDLSTDTYTTTVPVNTYGTGRFYLRLKDGTKTDIDPTPEDPGLLNVRLWATDNVVYVKGQVSADAIATIYDINGRAMQEKNLIEGTYNTFAVNNAVNGVYIVRIVDGAKQITKKVVIR